MNFSFKLLSYQCLIGSDVWPSLVKCPAAPLLRAANRDACNEHQNAPGHDLKRRRKERRIHELMADKGDDGELHRDDAYSDDCRDEKIGDEIGPRMAKAAGGRHRSTNHATQHGRPPSRKRAVVGKSLGKCHGDAGTNRSRDSGQKSLPRIMCRECRRKKRRQGRDRTVHQPTQARLYISQHVHAPRSLVLPRACRLGQDGFAELLGETLVFVFRVRKPVQQLPD